MIPWDVSESFINAMLGDFGSPEDALILSPERAEFEFYRISNITDLESTRIENQVSIYPNPTQGEVFVKAEIAHPTQFEIFSAIGEKIMDGFVDSNNKAIDLRHFPAGVYFVKFNNHTLQVLKAK